MTDQNRLASARRHLAAADGSLTLPDGRQAPGLRYMAIYTSRAHSELAREQDYGAALEYARAARTSVTGATIDVAALDAWSAGESWHAFVARLSAELDRAIEELEGERRQRRAAAAKAHGMAAGARAEAAAATGDATELQRAQRWCRAWAQVQARYRG